MDIPLPHTALFPPYIIHPLPFKNRNLMHIFNETRHRVTDKDILSGVTDQLRVHVRGNSGQNESVLVSGFEPPLLTRHNVKLINEHDQTVVEHKAVVVLVNEKRFKHEVYQFVADLLGFHQKWFLLLDQSENQFIQSENLKLTRFKEKRQSIHHV